MTRIVALLTGLAIIAASATTAHADISWAAGAPGGTSGTSIDFSGDGANMNGGSWLDTGIAGADISTGNYTISMWANAENLGTGNRGGNWFLGTGHRGLHLGVQDIGDPVTTRSAAFQGHWSNDSMGTSTINVNQWNHFTFSYDGTDQRIYVNGVLEATTAKGAPNVSNTNLLLGARQNNGAISGNEWNGKLDDVAFWNSALSGTNVTDLFNGTQTALGLGAGVYYNFENDVFGTTATVQGAGLGTGNSGASLTGITPNAVPEPSSLAIMLSIGVAGLVRRKRS